MGRTIDKMTKLSDVQKLAENQEVQELSPRQIEPVEELPPTAECICGGGNRYGHRNQADGICCPHYGNTCDYCTEW